ncbi:MAG: bifunctional metallophosphatase/5'-nucleotidase [Myxococcaceae bacterium]|jgi:5'-nucleotidase/UDP-sugar diphosphatase|nr:bifunctional metallophosphatase/5'-nucleotidase [Myxococcaceae bacterium]MCA3014287.1 bifunctional metallophosphatase/5'-nucleotidase [Myxococcaceae bacterium]
MPRRALLALAVVPLLACPDKKQAPAEPPHAAAPVDPKALRQETLTVLVTGAENGYLLPLSEEGTVRGGAAEVLGRWVAAEGHCAGPLAPNGDAPCPGAGTLVVSTGDNGNGQAISSFFRGEPTAEVMRQMGYAASALGNRELDWSRDQFVANRTRAGFPYLAANLSATDDDGKALGLGRFRVLTRRGVTVAIIGLAARKATVTPMPGRMKGLEAVDDATALAEVLPEVKKVNPQVIGVVSDGCLNDAPALLEGHADWGITFFAGRRCDGPFPDSVGATRLVYPGSRWSTYAKVSLTVTLSSTPVQVTSAVSSVEVLGGEGAPAPHPEVKVIVDGWKKKLDEALGGVIGFTKTGLAQESREMTTWLTSSLKERFQTDVALLNRKGVRQALPPGPVTKASVYDLVPFDNQVVVARLPGDALLAALENTEARVAGVKRKGDGWVDAKGAPLDPKKVYTVATTDYLYLGGDGFALSKADPAPTETKVSWQLALIEWTAGRKSDEKRPLESLVGAP